MKIEGVRTLRIVALIGVIYLLVRQVIDNPPDDQFFTAPDWSLLLPISILSVINILLEAVRYSVTAHYLGRTIPLFRSFAYLVAARFLNKFVPQSGLAYKAYVLHKAEGLGKGELLSGFGSLILLQLFVTLVIGIVVVGTYRPHLQIAEANVLWLLSAAALALVSGTAIAGYFSKKLNISEQNSKSIWFRFASRLAIQINTLINLVHQPKLLLVSAASILATTAVSTIRLYLCFEMMGLDSEISVLVLFVILNRLISVFVFTPGNLGVTELAFGVFAEEMNIGMAQGIAIALLLRLTAFVVLAVLGLLLLLFARETLFGENRQES